MMSSPERLEILDAASPLDRARWIELWASWPEREVQAHPTYAELFARPGDRALALTRQGRDSGVLWPIILRPLASEPWGVEGLWDATNPYGYGGAYIWGRQDASEAAAFLDAADAAMAELRVVTSFARLSLFPEQILTPRGEVVEVMQNVVRTLDCDPESMLRDYAYKVRKNVARARSASLTVEVDETGAELDAFLGIYASTMERREAAEGYRFPRSFFERIVQELPGSFAFFHVRKPDREIVSTELVLVSARNAYSFLGGTLASAFELRPNDLLKHQIIVWASARGLSTFVLGGGYGAEDGIFKYKLAFAPSGARPFRIMRRVHDEAAVAELIRRRTAHESAAGREWAPVANRFPPYRG